MTRKARVIVWLASMTLALIALAGGWLFRYSFRDPQAALLDFCEAKGRANDQLMDPLILCGRKVVPLVLDALRDPDMPRRGYAIRFLGHRSYREAIPVLEEILNNDTEVIYFRAAALRSLYLIDHELGQAHAKRFVDRGDPDDRFPDNDFLAVTSKDILRGDPHLEYRRTWWQARIGWHE